MKILAIYDNGGETLDRYTVVVDNTTDDTMHDMLGLSEGGDAYSQWTTGQYFDGGRPNKHLGKLVNFTTLSGKTQAHIARRIFGDQ